jgi:hypothetical protein
MLLGGLLLPSYIAHTTGGNATSVVLTKPSGTQNDDLMLTFISSMQANLTVTPPAGWTLVSSYTAATPVMFVYKKVAASEGASYTWGLSRDWNSCAVLTFRNVLNAVTVGGYTNAASGNAVASSITPTNGGGVLLMFAATDTSVSQSWTPDASMTELVDYQSNSSNNSGRSCLQISEKNPQDAAATGSKTATPAISTAAVTSVLLYLEAAS